MGCIPQATERAYDADSIAFIKECINNGSNTNAREIFFKNQK
jgi:hypothetical protein